MATTLLYGLFLKQHLFKLGGFVVKKMYKNLDRNNIIFYIKNNKISNIIINPALSVIQLINVFKFYINFVITSNNSTISVLLNELVLSLPVNNLVKVNYYVVYNFIGDLFSNFFVSSWFLVNSCNFKIKSYPALCIILNKELQGSFLRGLFNLAVPTVGFYNNNNERGNFLTFPIFLDCSVYILYFLLRIFLRLLYILKVKL